MITNELISEIKSKINDNQKQAITGGNLQGVLVDMVNGLTTKGLTFLGIISPGDPAPSNEPTRGYYLSFQASTKVTPYFNGVHLHRYSMLIWTQDETGRWKFKRIKYEDHRGPKRIVVGRALPIHYKDGLYTIHLSGDGTRDVYAVCGAQVLRGKKGGAKFNDPIFSLSPNRLLYLGSGRNNDKDIEAYVCFRFPANTDNSTFLSKIEIYSFLIAHQEKLYDIQETEACSPAYLFHKEIASFRWCPKLKEKGPNVANIIRRVKCYTNRPNRYASMPKNFVIKKYPGSRSQISEYRRKKRYRLIAINGKKRYDFPRDAGLSDNYISAL